MDDVICPPLSISSSVVSLWLAGCLAKSTVIGWRKYYGGGGVGVDKHLCGAQQTRDFDLMLFQYWPTANGAGPTLKQHRVKSSFLQGELSAFGYTGAVCVWLNRLHRALCTPAHAGRMRPLVTRPATCQVGLQVIWNRPIFFKHSVNQPVDLTLAYALSF